MSNQDVIRAWKDEEYRESLSESARSSLPENPVGPTELPDASLKDVTGGGTQALRSWGCTCFFTKATRGCGSCKCGGPASFGRLGCGP